MAPHKKIYTEYENQTIKQDFDHPQHFLISSIAQSHDIKGKNDSGRDNKYNNEIFYQYNLDDWQG